MLLRAAASAFGELGYHRTSVAAICRHARLANGTFYQYFANKEAIYLELVADTSEKLLTQIERSIPDNAPVLDQLIEGLRAYWRFIHAHTDHHQIMREAEFVRLEISRTFYRRLGAFYRSRVEQGQRNGEIVDVDAEAVAYALIGLSEFVALRYLIWDQAFNEGIVDAIVRLLREGVDRHGRSRDGTDAAMDGLNVARVNGSEARWDASTRSRVLAGGEAEFGRNGFHAASVADIARRAGVAHGTVYRYFPSKEALFAEVVREINRQLRTQIRRHTDDLESRRAAEEAGFRAFANFIGEHERMYRIVREAEFVGTAQERVGQWYYRRLAEGYQQGIQAAVERDEWREVNAEVLAWGLMGIAHFWGLRWIVWDQTMPPARVFEALDRLLCCGLTPSDRP